MTASCIVSIFKIKGRSGGQESCSTWGNNPSGQEPGVTMSWSKTGCSIGQQEPLDIPDPKLFSEEQNNPGLRWDTFSRRMCTRCTGNSWHTLPGPKAKKELHTSGLPTRCSSCLQQLEWFIYPGWWAPWAALAGISLHVCCIISMDTTNTCTHSARALDCEAYASRCSLWSLHPRSSRQGSQASEQHHLSSH